MDGQQILFQVKSLMSLVNDFRLGQISMFLRLWKTSATILN